MATLAELARGQNLGVTTGANGISVSNTWLAGFTDYPQVNEVSRHHLDIHTETLAYNQIIGLELTSLQDTGYLVMFSSPLTQHTEVTRHSDQDNLS